MCQKRHISQAVFGECCRKCSVVSFDLAFAERFKEAVRRAGGPSAVAPKLGKSLKTLSRYMSGETHPGFVETIELCKLAGVPIDWMMPGTTDFLPPKTSADNPSEMVKQDDFVLIPMLDVVGAAGRGIENHSEDVIKWLPFPRPLLRSLRVKPENAHFMTSRGDSMTPTIADGAIVLVDAGYHRVRDDGVYALVMHDVTMIKRVKRSFDGSLTLISDNSDKYPPDKLAPGEAESLRVAGKVFWTGSVV